MKFCRRPRLRDFSTRENVCRVGALEAIVAIPRGGAAALAGDAGGMEVGRSCGRRAPRGDKRIRRFPGFPSRIQGLRDKMALLIVYGAYAGTIKMGKKWLEEYLLVPPRGVERMFTSEKKLCPYRAGSCTCISCGKQLS